MSGENGAAPMDSISPSDAGQKRERSAIAFPYDNLADAEALAQAIHDHVGPGGCDEDQLAAWLGQSPKSSSFRVQLSAARMFGLIDTAASDRRLSDLGRRLVDPTQARAARVAAFMNVPLYAAVFERYRGGVLPPAGALQRDMIGLGVAQKQGERARQVFERSAEHAGFFEHGRDRLVRPGVRPGEGEGAPPQREERGGGNGGGGTGSGDGGGGGDDLALDQLIIELLRKIPSTKDGWPKEKRVRWFRTFAMNVSQIYDMDDDPVELKIELAKE